MSGDEEKRTKESTSKVIPEEPAALQELEDRLMDKLLRKVREEAGSEEPGEPKHVHTTVGCDGWVPGRAGLIQRLKQQEASDSRRHGIG